MAEIHKTCIDTSPGSCETKFELDKQGWVTTKALICCVYQIKLYSLEMVCNMPNWQRGIQYDAESLRLLCGCCDLSCIWNSCGDGGEGRKQLSFRLVSSTVCTRRVNPNSAVLLQPVLLTHLLLALVRPGQRH